MPKSARMPPLTAKLGITLPIIQAPMAGVSTPALAAAVSNAGGLGSLGVGAMNAEQARSVIRETRALTSHPFNVNLFCHAPATSNPALEAVWLAYLEPYFREFEASPPATLAEIYTSFNVDFDMLAMLLEERPAVVSFHFGLPPASHIDALRAAGVVLLASATNLEEARQIEAAGLDAVIAQGIEAGGHRGMFDPDARDEGLSTFSLTRLVVRETKLPVIAAGGIMDGAGIAAVLALGAEAAQLGTAFVACPESSADAAHRAALLGERAKHTAFTTAISGRPARGIFNRFTALGEAEGRPAIPAYPLAYVAGKALNQAAIKTGSSEFAAHWAGQAACLSRALPAAELVAVLNAELHQALVVKR